MPNSDTHIDPADAEAAHAAASRQIERLDEIGQALEVAHRALSALRTEAEAAQDRVTEIDRTIARARADLTELATALPVHLAELQRAAREPPPVRGHRY